MTKKTKLSQEELCAQSLVRDLKDLRENHYIPDPPSYVQYKVGQQVQMGNVKQSIVTEVVDGGMIYKLHQICTENNYGKPYDIERDMYVAWYDICPYHTPEEEAAIEHFSEVDDLRIGFSQRDMSGILIMAYHFGLDLNPDYQRGNVWTMDDKLKLISSIFMNVDIGKFVFVHLPYKDNSPAYEVLDGKQRIIAITEFYESRYKFNGKYFKDLCFRDQDHFERHPISYAELKEGQVKLSDKYRYFLRLNTGGRVQDPEHIKYVEEMYRKAVEMEKKGAKKC